MYEINGVFPSIAEAPGEFGFPGASGGFGPVAGPPTTGGLPDGVRPNWWNPPAVQDDGSASGGGILGALQQLAASFGQQVQGLLGGSSSSLGGSSSSLGSGTSLPLGGVGSPFGGDQTFANATLGSVGDPHLSLSGTLDEAGGNTTDVDATFNNMGSHPDLFSSPSFRGGFEVSTQATAPEANGVTYNQSATASFDGGRDTVTLDADGALQIDADGQSVSLADGSSTTLPGGTTINRASDGSVTIDASNAWGGRLATTFQATGSGVNVTAQGQDVALGGALIGEALQNSTA